MREDRTEMATSPNQWDCEVDVVVVGFGAAGASAALEARQHGASVLVLDRFHAGGTTAASGAVVYAGGGTPYQKQAGFEDTPEEMYRYLKMEVGAAVSDATLRRFCDESAANLAWLEEAGVPFEASLCPFKTSYPPDQFYLYFSGNEQVAGYKEQAKPAPRGHRAKGPGISGLTLFHALHQTVLKRGIAVRCQAEVQHLVLSPEGQILGVEGRALKPGSGGASLHGRLSKINAKATTYAPSVSKRITAILEWMMARQATPFRVRARKAVILAAGGFAFNAARVGECAPIYLRCLPLGTVGDDGAGIALGESAGGATGRMDSFSMWRFYVPPEALMQGVLVNRQGKRFCAEDLYGATQGGHIVEQGGDAYLVFDSRTFKTATSTLRKEAAFFMMLSMLMMLIVGRKKAPTLRALAAKLGVSAEGLEATMRAYNVAAGNGQPDPLGKADEYFLPQNTPPFYAVDCSLDSRNGVPGVVMSLGGLVVDEMTGEVRRVDGSNIPGLYAAGRNAVGICSERYVSGLSIADCVFSGRRAGRHAALRA
jgi:3-oxo-5alpha-steroid 4-dehydrogenase